MMFPMLSKLLIKLYLHTVNSIVVWKYQDLNYGGYEQYLYPTDEKIRKVGVTGLFFGHYLGWDLKKQLGIGISKGRF